jgi:hypothetical protein
VLVEGIGGVVGRGCAEAELRHAWEQLHSTTYCRSPSTSNAIFPQ